MNKKVDEKKVLDNKDIKKKESILKKKKSKRNLWYCLCEFNIQNTIISIADETGNVISWSSAQRI